jgi:hypothetical protein
MPLVRCGVNAALPVKPGTGGGSWVYVLLHSLRTDFLHWIISEGHGYAGSAAFTPQRIGGIHAASKKRCQRRPFPNNTFSKFKISGLVTLSGVLKAFFFAAITG